MTCAHETPKWNLTGSNEDGWACDACDHAFGFRPDFDREHTISKVETILFWLHEFEFINVSNATHGEIACARVARTCHAHDTFDQASIVKMLVDAVEGHSHADVWRLQAKQFMCSHPSRTLVPRPTRQNPDGAVSRCNACEHEIEQKPAGPLFADVAESKEPF